MRSTAMAVPLTHTDSQSRHVAIISQYNSSRKDAATHATIQTVLAMAEAATFIPRLVPCDVWAFYKSLIKSVTDWALFSVWPSTWQLAPPSKQEAENNCAPSHSTCVNRVAAEYSCTDLRLPIVVTRITACFKAATAAVLQLQRSRTAP